MDDETGLRTVYNIPPVADRVQADADLMERFDERAYLDENPDVAEAIARGDVPSGYAHYLMHGLHEGRLPGIPPREPRQVVVRLGPGVSEKPPAREFKATLEAALVSRSGGILLIGWVDDSVDPVDSVRFIGPGWRLTFDGACLARVRRADVEEAVGKQIHHPYGFYGFLFASGPLAISGPCKVEIQLQSGLCARVDAAPMLVEDAGLRDVLLTYVSAADHFGNTQVQAIAGLDRSIGLEIIRLNRHLTRALIASPYTERFGRMDANYDGSLVICLYGKPEFLFLQAALYGAVAGMDRYELIFVSNSPELAETLLREAKASSRIYGLDITVVILPGNAGFGAANNVAVKAARSDRILIVNPDVFPMAPDWATRHSDILSSAPREGTRFFGAPLYYDDGSLMHGGMFFEIDSVLSHEDGRPRLCELARVEHYGKGTPPELPDFVRPRPVPAVTGAFMSWDRSWFEALDGFSHDYVFGHYEDADLCLRSLQAGVPPWIQDLKMWHLEGKGSVKLPRHEGGSLVNRWLFSCTWGETIAADLLGPAPNHPLLRPPARRRRS
ncbi:MAG TPA: glycosyltransferase [Elusimicrobiota bacterium]|nr:glycosyltransferase [Elusimicrobiota bacterium]